MSRYRKKPVVIEAVQYTDGNISEILAFAGGTKVQVETDIDGDRESLVVHTLEGNMRVSDGDFVIQGVQGEFYPCKPDIFAQTYDLVEEEINA